MSRAISIDASVEQVTDYCAKQGLGISVIEPLLSGGTRVVLTIWTMLRSLDMA